MYESRLQESRIWIEAQNAGAADDDDEQGVAQSASKIVDGCQFSARARYCRDLILITLQLPSKRQEHRQLPPRPLSFLRFLRPMVIRRMNHMYTLRHTRIGTLVTSIHPHRRYTTTESTTERLLFVDSWTTRDATLSMEAGQSGMTSQRSVRPATPSHGPAIPSGVQDVDHTRKRAMKLVSSLLGAAAWSVTGYKRRELKPASTSLVAARRPARRHQVKRCSALACEPHTLAPHVPSLPCLRHNGHHLRLPHPHWPSPICTSSLDGPPSIATFRTFSQPPILLLPLLLHDQQFQFIRVLFLSSYSEQIITCISEKL